MAAGPVACGPGGGSIRPLPGVRSAGE